MLILSEPLRLRHLPYPRYCAAEEDIATYPLSTAHNRIFANFTLNHKPSTLNPKLSTIKIRYSSKRLTARRSSVSRSNKPAMRSSGSMFAPSDLATAGF